MSQNNKIEKAMVFAAGLGNRMRPITDTIPKPLIKIAGKSMLDYALDSLESAGVKLAVVNSHYLAEQVHEHLKNRDNKTMEVVISHEPTLLETGGGIVKALKYFGDQPFFSVNSDIIWLDGKIPALDRLNATWDAKTMDILMLVNRKDSAVGYDEQGDFEVNDKGQVYYPRKTEFDYVYTGVQIIKPGLFKDEKEEPFSLTKIYKSKFQPESGVLKGIYAVVHDGKWLHVGTPESIAPAELEIRKG